MQDLTQRIETLEQHNRWLKRAFLLLALGVVGQFLLGANLYPKKKPAVPAAGGAVQTYDTLYVKTLVVGEPKNQRVHMTTQPDGAFLIMYDEAGVQRWRVAAKKSGTYSQMYNAKGKLIKMK